MCGPHFNLNGVQATTHVAAPLVVVNGPVRQAREALATGAYLFDQVGDGGVHGEGDPYAGSPHQLAIAGEEEHVQVHTGGGRGKEGANALQCR